MSRILFFSFFLLIIAGCEKDTAFEPELAINQRAVYLSAISDTAKMMVYSSGNWTVENRDNATWVMLQKGSGNGQDYAIVSVTDNSTALPRATTLVVRSGSLSDTFKLGQRGIVPKIAITAASVASPAAGGIIQTAIDANISLAIMKVSFSDWISDVQIVDKNLGFKVAANTTAATRKGVIYMSYLDAIGTNTLDSLVVNQAKP